MFKSFKAFDSGMTRSAVKCEALLSIFRQERGMAAPALRQIAPFGAAAHAGQILRLKN